MKNAYRDNGIFFYTDNDLQSFWSNNKLSKLGKINITFIGACTTRNTHRYISMYADKSKILSRDPWENLFNPPVILNELKRICLNSSDKEYLYFDGESYTDELRPWIKSNDIETCISLNNKYNTALRKIISETNILYCNLGSAEIWKIDDHVFNKIPLHNIKNMNITSQFLSTQEIEDILHSIVRYLTLINPEINILFSIPFLEHKASAIRENLNITTFKSTVAIYKAISNSFPDSYYPEYELSQYVVGKVKDGLQIDGRHFTATAVSILAKNLLTSLQIPICGTKNSFWVPKVDKFGKIIGKCYL